ncbi:ATPase [Lactobacillus delbrueckii subsp. bulgaricus]|nr:ATPase [Lactobacillus delbrueckii subsp. bulgaricus]MBT8878493.1 ATPase [Lactobacillus delbrueckii subsp. bulgaricus]
MKTITITNQKGGTGKTSLTLLLAYGLADAGHTVLVIDLDQQCDASYLLTRGAYNSSQTSYEVLAEEQPLRPEEVYSTIAGGIDLVPASPRLNRLDTVLAGKLDVQFRLSDALDELERKYDYVLIDTPPAINFAVQNALTAADGLIIPVQADLLSLKGMQTLESVVKQIRRRSNPRLKIYGVAVMRYQAQTVFARSISQALDQISEELDTKTYNHTIREATAVKEAENAFSSLYEYAKNAPVTEDARGLLKEVMEDLEHD